MENLVLNYQLAELPSAQHRAGLAGLVLMVRELERHPWFEEREGAIANLQELDEYGVTLELNLEGLKALFELTYGAFIEERVSTNKIEKYDRIEEVEIEDKKGKQKLVKRYYYSVTVPHGAFLAAWDKSSTDENNGLWIKLWRDMLWNIVRGVPATRNPFDNRANGGTYSKDAESVWQDLQNPDKATGQSGNYYLGAMAFNAENVPTKDTISNQFLLHFWPFVTQVYCPATLDKDGRRQLSGYALAIPDVSNLDYFCEDFRAVLQAREPDAYRHYPREAVIDLPEEGALDLLRLLRDRISHKAGSQTLEDLILGVELIHAEKEGNSVKIRSISYVEPISSQVDRYAEIRKSYWCPWFRRQRLLNLLYPQRKSENGKELLVESPAWQGFDAVLSRIPRQWLEDRYFSHDARELFTNEISHQGDNKMETKVRDYANIVYQVCQHYVLSKLESKFELKWKQCKGNPQKVKEYNKKKYKVANEAFLAVRSRTEPQAFVDYFVSTLYPFVRKEEFAEFAEALFNQTDEIRALTLLALSSQFPLPSEKPEEESTESEAA